MCDEELELYLGFPLRLRSSPHLYCQISQAFAFSSFFAPAVFSAFVGDFLFRVLSSLFSCSSFEDSSLEELPFSTFFSATNFN